MRWRRRSEKKILLCGGNHHNSAEPDRYTYSPAQCMRQDIFRHVKNAASAGESWAWQAQQAYSKGQRFRSFLALCLLHSFFLYHFPLFFVWLLGWLCSVNASITYIIQRRVAVRVCQEKFWRAMRWTGCAAWSGGNSDAACGRKAGGRDFFVAFLRKKDKLLLL